MPTTPIEAKIILMKSSIVLEPFISFIDTPCLVEVGNRLGGVID
jgi:hypothetical protein